MLPNTQETKALEQRYRENQTKRERAIRETAEAFNVHPFHGEIDGSCVLQDDHGYLYDARDMAEAVVQHFLLRIETDLAKNPSVE